MRYKHNMKNEKPPRQVLPEGWREFKIVDIQETVSKAGNTMFIVSLSDKETEAAIDVYCIATEGKRWMLKSLLTALGVTAGQDGVYDWDADEVIGKMVSGKVKNEDEEWIDREGEKRTTPKSKIMEFKVVGERPY